MIDGIKSNKLKIYHRVDIDGDSVIKSAQLFELNHLALEEDILEIAKQVSAVKGLVFSAASYVRETYVS